MTTSVVKKKTQWKELELGCFFLSSLAPYSLDHERSQDSWLKFENRRVVEIWKMLETIIMEIKR